MATAWLDAYDDALATLPTPEDKAKVLNVAMDLYESFKTVPGVDIAKIDPITEGNAGDALNQMYNEVKAKQQSAGRRRTRRGKGKKKAKKSRKSRR